jgi:hypothetical protein
MATFFTLTFLPVQSYASATGISNSLVVSKLPEKGELSRKFKKNRETDVSKLNPSDKNNSRGIETNDGRHHHNGMNKGMYVSVGCTFLLMLLVIILI